MGVKRRLALVGILLFNCSVAEAGICDKGSNLNFSKDTVNEESYYRKIFPEALYFGNDTYNKVILECNRKRDTKGKEIQKALGGDNSSAMKSLLEAGDLDWKVIRGNYNFYGFIGSQQKYRYLLRKKNGVWEMILPYDASINDIVKNRADIFMGYRRVLNADTGALELNDQSGPAWNLFDASQVRQTRSNSKVAYELKDDAKPIAETHCENSQYFKNNDKYVKKHGFNASGRDHENKHINLGLIQYRYKRYDNKKTDYYDPVYEGCRISQSMKLYWLENNAENPDGSLITNRVVQTTPKKWIFDNFIRVGEDYWSTPSNFKLRIWLKGYNDADFGKNIIAKFENSDPLTVYFATKFMGNGANQMYKSNPIQFNNFSTMTTDGTYRHEVGHAFGLDDEYGGGSKNDCQDVHYNKLGSPHSDDYMMCNGYSSGLMTTIYHYIAVSRYGTIQKECSNDGDCKAGEWCDAGVDLKKNQCRVLLSDGEACPLVGGGHACKSGNCKFGKCYTSGSVAMGGSCFVNDQCAQGKCNNVVDGANGTCVCKNDSECGAGFYCDAGLDIKKNTCRTLKADNSACSVVNGGRTCASGSCTFGRCSTPGSVSIGGLCYVNSACKSGQCSSGVNGTKGECVCNSDRDCGSNSICKVGTLGVGKNQCVATRVPVCKSGWRYETRNPLNRDRCNRTTTRTAALECESRVGDLAKNWTGPHAKNGTDECRSKKGKKPKGVKCPSGYSYNRRSGADTCTRAETEHETPTCPIGWNYKSQSGRDICEDT